MMLKFLVALVAWLAPGSLPAAAATAAGDGAAVSWVQLVPGGGAEIRVAVLNDCPHIVFDRTNGPKRPLVDMQVRASADPAFPVVCSLPIPPGTKTAALVTSPFPADFLYKDLPVPVADPQRILVLGDTGCRIKGTYLQACNDPVAWPFAGLAKAAAALKPDLVIHLGDYLYRESLCPDGNAGCAGSPYGDNWASWNADLFSPAAPLLDAAPWLIVRGNHEDCSRA